MTAVATPVSLHDGGDMKVSTTHREDDDVELIIEDGRIISPEALPPGVTFADLASNAFPPDPITGLTLGKRQEQRARRGRRLQERQRDVKPGLRDLTPAQLSALRGGARIITPEKSRVLKSGLRTLSRDERRALKAGDCLFGVDLSEVRLTRYEQSVLDANRARNRAKTIGKCPQVDLEELGA